MRRATVLGGALVLLALLATVVGAAHRAEMSGRATAAGSSFRADEAGHRAARLLLEAVGIEVRSRRGARLPEGTGHVLIRVEGLPGVSPEDVPQRERESEGSALEAWVARGNAVLLLGGDTPPGSGFPVIREAHQLPDTGLGLGPPVAAPEADGIDAIFGRRPDVPSAGDGIVERHELPDLHDPWISPFHAVTPAPGDTVLVERVGDGETDAVVVAGQRGSGCVIAVADPWFATNVRLGAADNAAWLVALVERLRRDGDVWFDDRAVGQTATRGVLSLLFEGGLGPAFLAGAVLLALVWWRVGPSDAPDRLVRPREEYRPEAYADLRAGLYADCLTGDEVRRMVQGEVVRRLGRGDGVSYERAIALLQVRDPERAQRLTRALDGLPRHRDVSVTRHAATWSAAVSRVWNVLSESPETGAPRTEERR